MSDGCSNGLGITTYDLDRWYNDAGKSTSTSILLRDFLGAVEFVIASKVGPLIGGKGRCSYVFLKTVILQNDA